MKSGTTTLYDYLAQHPQIANGLYKEPSFFAFEEKWALGLGWYESQFNFDPKKHRYAIDASTDYSKYPFCCGIVERLKASAPRRFKLIYIMRHPLRRIESHARHVARTMHEIGQFPSPRKSHSLDKGISPVSIAISHYAQQIDGFLEYYDKGELLLLTLEQLEREPKVVLRKIYEFLDIDPLMPDDATLRSNVAESWSSSDRISNKLHLLWQALHGVAVVRAAVKATVPSGLRTRIYHIVRKSVPPEGRFTLNEDEAKEVIDKLASDLCRLRDRYGIDIEKEWGIRL